jgi:hypothetical protein
MLDETPNNIIKECDAPPSKGLKIHRRIVLSRLFQGMRNLQIFKRRSASLFTVFITLIQFITTNLSAVKVYTK